MVSTDVTEEGEQRRGLAALYARHAIAAGRLAYLLTGSNAEAEDLVQEAFARVVGRFGHLRVPDAFEAYLRRTIVNLHTSRLRRLRLERAFAEREGRRTPETVGMPDVGVRQALWQALLALPPRQRAAVVLRYYEDLSEADTAQVLGCSVAAVKSLVARAMKTLRTTVADHDPRDEDG
jgi:RNA polymerase sigma-70 factor (sigma-E family)